MGKTGKVLRIEKTSIHDGEGLRTVVFTKGCPLRCKWCSTPESWNMECDENYGKEMTAEQVVKEVCKDEIFFFHSGGGVTISGGEILMQADFVREILEGCREHGIPAAVESSLFGKYEEIEKLLPYLTDFYFDYKMADEDLHKEYIGVSNQIICENMERLCREFKGGIHMRIPTVPTVNMTVDNMEKTADWIKRLGTVTDVELLPYHRLGMDTYKKLGLTYELPEITSPSVEELQEMADILLKQNPGLTVKIKGEVYKPQ